MTLFHEHTKKYWDGLADDYQSQTHIAIDDFHYGPLLPGDRTLKLLPQSLEGLECLELGAGAAQNSLYLASSGAICTAVDISPNQLAYGQTLARKHKINCTFICHDFENLQLNGDLFDIVHSTHALSFAEDQQAAIHRMASFLKPGGKLVLSTLHPLSSSEWVDLEDESGVLVKDYFNPPDDCRDDGDGAQAHSQPLTMENLINWIQDSGLVIERVLEPRCTLSKRITRHAPKSIPYWSPAWLEHIAELSKVPFTVIIIASKPKILGTTAQHEPDSEELAAKLPFMKCRAAVLKSTRHFFEDNGFLEVITPVRIPAPALEDYIDAEPSGTHWLRTSPELHMKRILAAGEQRIFQIGPCFRMGENGSRHLPEFQMLEWYRRQDNWRTVLNDTVQLLRKVAHDVLGTGKIHFRNEFINLDDVWDEITVEQAFRKYADTDLDQAIADGRFEEILCTAVEPNLGHGRPTVLSEYPLACSGLSQPIPGRPNRVERWELYVAGLELGNACSELVDPDEQLRRFQATAKLRGDDHREVYPIDEPFMDAIRRGIPPSAGVAIGFDRFVMMISDSSDIHEIAFN